MAIARRIAPAAACIAMLMIGQAAYADLLIDIDKSAQRMTVIVDGRRLYDWPVATGGTTATSGTTRRCPTRSSSL